MQEGEALLYQMSPHKPQSCDVPHQLTRWQQYSFTTWLLEEKAGACKRGFHKEGQQDWRKAYGVSLNRPSRRSFVSPGGATGFTALAKSKLRYHEIFWQMCWRFTFCGDFCRDGTAFKSCKRYRLPSSANWQNYSKGESDFHYTVWSDGTRILTSHHWNPHHRKGQDTGSAFSTCLWHSLKGKGEKTDLLCKARFQNSGSTSVAEATNGDWYTFRFG